MVISTALETRTAAAASPANPPPMMTILGRLEAERPCIESSMTNRSTPAGAADAPVHYVTSSEPYCERNQTISPRRNVSHACQPVKSEREDREPSRDSNRKATCDRGKLVLFYNSGVAERGHFAQLAGSAETILA